MTFRPEKTEPQLTAKLVVRLSEEGLNELNAVCQRLGMTRNDFTRQALCYAISNMETDCTK